MIPSICFHCGLALNGAQFTALILQKEQFFCCLGCKAVAEAIVENGLENYYLYRSENAERPNEDQTQLLETLSIYDTPELIVEYSDRQGEISEIQLSISGINCAACGWLIEKQLSKLPGIAKIGANVTTKRLYVSWYPQKIKLSDIVDNIKKIGYRALPFQTDQHEALHQLENKQLLKRLGLAGLMTMQVMMLNLGVFFDWFGHIDQQTLGYFSWVSLILSTPVALYSATGFYRSAYISLRSYSVNMDVPISLALISIYLSSCYATIFATGQTYFESLTMFIFLLLISRYIEQTARYKAAQISANLVDHIPSVAIKIIDGKHTTVLAKQLLIGDKVLVKAGDIIPIDGKVIDGLGQVNESMLSGEFALITKQQNDKVYAGTINQVGTLIISVQQVLAQSLVNQISQLQTKALLNKPKLANFADRFARYFVLSVLVIAVITFGYWYISEPQSAFWITIAVLIATCPCALGLATPVSLTCAIGNLNKKGVLIKRADVLEQLPQLDWLGLDKTGTLTQGKFTLESMHNFSTISDKEIMTIAASLEQFSSHPLSLPFSQSDDFYAVSQVEEVIAKGIAGKINNIPYKIGSASFMAIDIASQFNDFNVFLAKENTLLAAFKLSDALRENAQDTLKKLPFKTTVLLSGDTETAVKNLAKQLNIVNWYSSLSPQRKLSLIQEAQQQGQRVLMIGDGINDAPVLAQADVSITLGLGTDLAKSSADVILLDNDLSKIPYVIKLAIKTNRVIKQNIAWAIAYNMVVLPLAIAGQLSPLLAVIGMSLSSLIVVINSTRLLSK